MVEYKGGIFDVGGVLHTNEMSHVRADIKAYFGLSDDEFKAAWGELSLPLGKGLITEEQFWEHFIRRTGKTVVLPRESLLLREFTRRFQKNDEVLAIIAKLKSTGLKLAVLSNSVSAHADFLRSINLFKHFGPIIFSNEVGMHKPDPRIYLLTLERLGTDRKGTFFVDDAQENIDAAVALGVTGILFTSPTQLYSELHRLGIL